MLKQKLSALFGVCTDISVSFFSALPLQCSTYLSDISSPFTAYKLCLNFSSFSTFTSSNIALQVHWIATEHLLKLQHVHLNRHFNSLHSFHLNCHWTSFSDLLSVCTLYCFTHPWFHMRIPHTLVSFITNTSAFLLLSMYVYVNCCFQLLSAH